MVKHLLCSLYRLMCIELSAAALHHNGVQRSYLHLKSIGLHRASHIRTLHHHRVGRFSCRRRRNQQFVTLVDQTTLRRHWERPAATGARCASDYMCHARQQVGIGGGGVRVTKAIFLHGMSSKIESGNLRSVNTMYNVCRSMGRRLGGVARETRWRALFVLEWKFNNCWSIATYWGDSCRMACHTVVAVSATSLSGALTGIDAMESVRRFSSNFYRCFVVLINFVGLSSVNANCWCMGLLV